MEIPFPFLMGIPWEWGLLAKMGTGVVINQHHRNGNDAYSHVNPFPLSFQRMQATVSSDEYNDIL